MSESICDQDLRAIWGQNVARFPNAQKPSYRKLPQRKVKTVIQIYRHMTLDNFGAPILSIDMAGFIIRKIFMQPS
jgi:hypothetical protein